MFDITHASPTPIADSLLPRQRSHSDNLESTTYDDFCHYVKNPSGGDFPALLGLFPQFWVISITTLSDRYFNFWRFKCAVG